MATYIPNATQTTEPVESRTVESAALEFRTLKASVNSRVATVQSNLDAETTARIAGDANLQTQNNSHDVRIQAVETALQVISEGGLPGNAYVQRLSGTGAQTSFTLDVSAPPSALSDVYINGVYQNKDTFTIVGDVLTFSEAPPAGTDNIEVVILSVIASVESKDTELRLNLADASNPANGSALIGHVGGTVAEAIEGIKERAGFNSVVQQSYVHAINVNAGKRLTIGAFFVNPNTKKMTILGREGGTHNNAFAAFTRVVSYTSADAFSSGLGNPTVVDDSVGDPLSPVSGSVMGGNRWGVICLRVSTTSETYEAPAFLYSDDFGVSWTKVVLPGASGVIRFPHGKIMAYPASVGGHDTNGWIVYCYDGSGGLWESHTVDNGATWSAFAQILASSADNAASETVVVRVGSENKWVLISRNETDSTQYAIVSTSVDMLTWSTPAISTLRLGKNPPAIVEKDGNAFLLTSSRDRYIGEGLNTILSQRLDLSEIYATSGASGWGSWQVLAVLPNFAYGYFQDAQLDGKTYIALGAGDLFNTGISAYMVSDVPSDPSIPAIRAVKRKNLLVNGSLKVLQGASSGSAVADRQTTLDNWGLSRVGYALGYSWSVLNSYGGRRALRITRDQGDTGTAVVNLINVLGGADVVALRGKTVSLVVECRSALSSTASVLSVNVQSTPYVGKVTSSDGSIPSRTLFDIGAFQTRNTPTKVVNTFVVPTDANMLVIGINATYVGTGAEFDFFELYGAALVEGPYATEWEDRSTDEELAACQKLLFRSYDLGVSAGTATISGAVGVVADGTSGAFLIPVRTPVMRATPTVSLYALDGTAGQATMAGTGAKINVAANATGTGGFNIVNTATPAAGDKGNLARCHYVADAQWW